MGIVFYRSCSGQVWQVGIDMVRVEGLVVVSAAVLVEDSEAVVAVSAVVAPEAVGSY